MLFEVKLFGAVQEKVSKEALYLIHFIFQSNLGQKIGQ
jgi:hypothetical protein